VELSGSGLPHITLSNLSSQRSTNSPCSLGFQFEVANRVVFVLLKIQQEPSFEGKVPYCPLFVFAAEDFTLSTILRVISQNAPLMRRLGERLYYFLAEP